MRRVHRSQRRRDDRRQKEDTPMTQTITQETLAAFARALADEERAAATIAKYRRDAAAFARWLGARPLDKAAATGWKTALLARGYAPVTINAMLAALNSLLRFLGRDDCRLRYLRVQRRLFRDPARSLSLGEYRQLLAAARARRDQRLALILETLCATGIRVSELAAITADAAQAGRAEIHLKGKIRLILLPRRLCDKLLRYARARRLRQGPIFRRADGRPLSRQQIWQMMKTLAARAGVAPGKVFPHNLRRLFAVTYYGATGDIVRLADVLGHSSVETTRLYLLTTSDELHRVLDQLPLVS